METKHTPGPWAVRPQPFREGFKFAVCGEDFWPAAIFSDGRNNAGTAEANACLIAAAPELLEALRVVREALHECRRYVDISDDNGFAAYIAGGKAEGVAYDAIDKATGRA